MIFSTLTYQQAILVAVPPVLLATTWGVFRGLATQFQPETAYLGGFLFYWGLWCLLLPLLLIGPIGVTTLFTEHGIGNPIWLGMLLLLGPLLVTYPTQFPAGIKEVTTAVIIVSVAYAIVNGTLEELLWRGTYVALFPDNWWWGVIYPSIGFGLWHLAPQTIYPAKGRGRVLPFAIMAIFLGLAWGWVTLRSGSIRWTVAAHILLNFAVPAGRNFLGRD